MTVTPIYPVGYSILGVGFNIKHLRSMRTATSRVLETRIEARELIADLSDALGKISDEIAGSIEKGKELDKESIETWLQQHAEFYADLRKEMMRRPSLAAFFKKLATISEESRLASPVRSFRIWGRSVELDFSKIFELLRTNVKDLGSDIKRATFQFLMWAMNREELIVIGPQIYAAAITIGFIAMWPVISNLALQIGSGLARALFAICTLYAAMWTIYRETGR